MAMENIHRSSLRPWISKPVELRAFRDRVADTVSGYKGFTTEEDFSGLLQEMVDEGVDIKALNERCGPDAFTCRNEDKIELAKSFDLPENADLMTAKLQKEDMERRKKDPGYRLFIYNNRMRARSFPPSEPLSMEYGAVSQNPSNLIKLPEVLLTVQIFRPERALHKTEKRATPRVPAFVVDQEFMLYGNQFLTALRDKIECVTDLSVRGDFSDNPSLAAGPCMKNIYKSGFFYINGVFYNDTRDQENKDYSENIIKWSKEGNRGVGPFSKAPMETTRFIDISLQLGYPYVYLHQGYCEHLMIFTDLRMMNKEDCLGCEDYPLIVSVVNKRPVVCMVCHVHVAKWIVTKNERLPETPYFFCTACFRMFNYTKNGQKIGSFQARKFPDRTLIL